MKRFGSLMDGIHYMSNCPLCHNPLQFDQKGYDAHTIRRTEQPSIELVFDLNGKDTMTIDAELGTCKIEISLNHETYQGYGKYGCYYPTYGGIVFLGMDCLFSLHDHIV